MNIKQVEKILKDGGIEPNEAKIEAKMFVKHFCGLTETALILKNEFKECEDLMKSLEIRVKQRIPIQQIIGSAYFMGEDFIVNDKVLIPRDETEILVRKAVEIINKYEFRKVLDIGTGSGCIACIIAKLTDAQALGVDISTDALQIALDNSSKLKLFNRAIFRKSDIFSNIRNDGANFEKFDLIISNPPYIPPHEKSNIQREVSYEPELALYATDKNGIEFYEKIISQAHDYLNPNGYLMFELGINQSSLVKELLEANNFKNIEIIKDLAYIDRVIVGNIGEKGD